jgi:superfamily II DNA helicase RecQ
VKLAKALRGSRARGLGELSGLPELGALRHESEAAVVAAIDQLISERRLIRMGRTYPTVWLPGRPIRAAAPSAKVSARRSARAAAGATRLAAFRTSEIARELERYRQRMARQLAWKSYMVFQRKVIVAIDRHRPQTAAELARIPGLGAARIARFGDDILAMVRRHA